MGMAAIIVNGPQTFGRTDEGQKAITIAHPEHSSSELKTMQYVKFNFLNSVNCEI